MSSTMSLLCNRKDPITRHDKSGVYILPCSNCDSVYIGETGRKMHLRVHEHLEHQSANSPFLKHLTTNQHMFQAGSERLLHQESSFRRRLALETLKSARYTTAGFTVLNYSQPSQGVISYLFPPQFHLSYSLTPFPVLLIFSVFFHCLSLASCPNFPD